MFAQISVTDEIFRKSMPLQRAYLRYIPKEMQSQWQAIQGQSILAVMNDALRGIAGEQRSMTDSLALLSNVANAHETIRRKIVSAAQARCLEALQNESVIAFGYEAPRRVASVAYKLERHQFAKYSQWDNGELAINGIKFCEIRLVSAAAFDDACTVTPSQITRPVGRPSVAGSILEAFGALQSEGKINLTAPKIHCYGAVRGWIAHFRPEVAREFPNINNETIRRAISARFDAAQNTLATKQ